MNVTIKKIISFILISAVFAGCKKDEDSIAPNSGNLKPIVKLVETVNGQSFEYEINEGPKIVVSSNAITFTHKKYDGFRLVFFSNLNANNENTLFFNEEYLNGKHIKNRLDSVRTLVFQDGTKITLNTEGENGKLKSISFYSNSNSHVVIVNTSLISFTSNMGSIANQMDANEPDGETSIVEINSTGLIWDNIYTEDIVGEKVMKRVKLGELIKSSPNQVNDYFDDPRLAAT